MNTKETGLFRTTGDAGMTDLASGESISKSSTRVDLIGDIDELISILGAARAHTQSPKIAEEIISIQKALFSVNSEIAGYHASPEQTSCVTSDFMEQFEERVRALKSSLPVPQGFILPGNSKAEAFLHIARAVTRRCERKAVALAESKQITNTIILKFLNRLSSLLFLIANAEVQNPLYLNKT